jgi:hypothetical protein
VLLASGQVSNLPFPKFHAMANEPSCKGTMASLWQATIGNVAAGSWFATLTSAGMGGAGLATVQIVTVSVRVMRGFA